MFLFFLALKTEIMVKVLLCLFLLIKMIIFVVLARQHLQYNDCLKYAHI